MIRKAAVQDIPEIMNIIRDAQASIKRLGISQWQNGYPNETSFAKDIAEGISYVYEEDGEIVATAAIFCAPEPDYAVIYDGEWKTNGGYGVIHRVAVKKEAKRAGYAAKMIAYAEELTKEAGYGSLRMDTHEGNVPMRTFLKKQGFEECGMIYLSNEGSGDNKRVAYEKVLGTYK
ncbi:MAG: GNAT family N-acetyltransferase [Lachnospiraceae bacterium]|nr:GNAT family N-acetyltransferase [Lachnospiraceae bacterium]MBP3609138.1 GNAT family N-acetyltransferase [Lachnospiraceae bacterium]